MGLIFIFIFMCLLTAYATYRSWKEKNYFSFIFSGAITVFLGWFSVMTVFFDGLPKG